MQLMLPHCIIVVSALLNSLKKSLLSFQKLSESIPKLKLFVYLL